MNWKDTVEWLFFSTVIFALLYLLFTKKFLQFFGLLFLLMLTVAIGSIILTGRPSPKP